MSQKSYWIIGCLLLVVAVLVGCLVFGGTKARSYDVLANIKPRLQTGMTREQVEQVIGVDSKKRYSCKFTSGLTDVHLIGSSDPGRAALLYLDYREEADGTLVLQRIFSGMDQDMLVQFEWCPSDTPVATTPMVVPVRPTATD